MSHIKQTFDPPLEIDCCFGNQTVEEKHRYIKAIDIIIAFKTVTSGTPKIIANGSVLFADYISSEKRETKPHDVLPADSFTRQQVTDADMSEFAPSFYTALLAKITDQGGEAEIVEDSF